MQSETSQQVMADMPNHSRGVSDVFVGEVLEG